MSSDPRKLSDWLESQPDAVRKALSQSEPLALVNRAFRDWLAAPWADQVRIAQLGESTVIFAAHAAAATLLRFRAPAVLACIRERFEPACTSVQIKVQPTT